MRSNYIACQGINAQWKYNEIKKWFNYYSINVTHFQRIFSPFYTQQAVPIFQHVALCVSMVMVVHKFMHTQASVHIHKSHTLCGNDSMYGLHTDLCICMIDKWGPRCAKLLETYPKSLSSLPKLLQQRMTQGCEYLCKWDIYAFHFQYICKHF
jgi:hypothetical protein